MERKWCLTLVSVVVCSGIIAGMMAIVGCGTTAKTYNTGNYPNSLVLKMFEAAQINPEIFTQRIVRVVQAEIGNGKFTREQALAFVNKYELIVKSGTMPYELIADVMERYGSILLPHGPDVSEAATIAYYMLVPDLGMIQVDTPISQDDVTVLLKFLDTVEQGVIK